MRFTSRLVFAFALAAALPAAAQDQAPLMLPETAPAGAESSPFTDAERAALHAEIRNYMLAHPELLMEMLQTLEAQQKATTAENDKSLVAAHADALFEDGFSWVGGNPEGSFTLVEFLDYQCGFCRRAQPEIEQLIAADSDVRLIVKEMPILGPGSELAARAAVATMVLDGPEAYARLHTTLMGMKGQINDASLDRALVESGLDPDTIRAALNDPEVERRLAETRALAESLAISGTPTFVFDDRMVRGYLPLDEMQTLVSEIRETE